MNQDILTLALSLIILGLSYKLQTVKNKYSDLSERYDLLKSSYRRATQVDHKARLERLHQEYLDSCRRAARIFKTENPL